MKKHPTSVRAIIGAAVLFSAPPLIAQTAPAASTTTTSESVVKLDPFSVQADSDVGFVAASSLAGGRIATALKDTPVSYSVVTKEFLDAFNITDIGEAANFTVGADNWVGDQTDKGYSTGASGRVRVRGLSAQRVKNFFPLDNQTADSFNIDRVDYARGANAVLFGPGGASGVQNTQTKQALMNRSVTEVRLQVGSFSKYRFTADINRPVTDKIALRTNLLWSTKDHWRDRLWEDKQGFHLAATYQVTPKFTVRGEFEYMFVREAHAVQHWNDYLSAWDGKTYHFEAPLTGAGAPTAAFMAQAGIERANGTFVVRPDYGNRMINWKNVFRTKGANYNANAANTNWLNTPSGRQPIRTVGMNQEGQLPIDSALSQIGITDEIKWAPAIAGSLYQMPKPTDTLNWDDPGHDHPTFWQKTRDLALFLNYRVNDNLYIEAAGNVNEAPRWANNTHRRRTRWVRVDISRTLPTGEPNPWFLHPYSDQAEYYSPRSDDFKNLRLQSVYQKDTRFGKLQFGIMGGLQRQMSEARSSTTIIPATWILPDARGWIENGENNEFFVYKRVYLDEGDRRWAYQGGMTSGKRTYNTIDPSTGVSANLTPYWVYDSRRDTGVQDAWRDFEFIQAAGNLDLFNNRLVLIGAVRRDHTYFRQQRIKVPGWNPAGFMGITDLSQDWKLPDPPKDYWNLTYFPKDAAGNITGPERNADARPRTNAFGTVVPQPQYDKDRFRDDYNSPPVEKSVNSASYGAVVNITKWLGVFGNHSTTFNFSSPQQDIYNVLVPQPLSKSKDVGIRFNLPNNRLAASAAWFNATQKGSPTGTPSGFIGNYNAIGDLGPVGDLFNRNRYDFRQFRENNIATTSDTDVRGYEIELTGNLTPNWRLVLNASKADAATENYGADAVQFIKDNDAVVRKILADGGILINASTNLASINPAVNDPTLINIQRAEAAVNGWNGLVNNTIPLTLEQNAMRTPELGSTDRWMWNIATDYRFRSGRLNGLRTGLALNYRPGHVAGRKSGDTIVNPNNPAQAIDDPAVNASNPIYGSSYYMTKLTFAYTLNLKETRRFMPRAIHFDLVVDNVFNDKDAQFGYSTGSQNTSEQVFLPRNGQLSDPSRYSAPGNVFYMDPRTYTLTARMEF
jgi:outer membrane receptor for ferric coprogen and ferric-rhodotorulic acid